MRYTIHKLHNDIEQVDNDIQKALALENVLADRVDDDKCTIAYVKDNNNCDGWDYFEANKAARYLPHDLKHYQQQISVRLRLEKQKRVLEQRVKKIQDSIDSENRVISENLI